MQDKLCVHANCYRYCWSQNGGWEIAVTEKLKLTSMSIKLTSRPRCKTSFKPTLIKLTSKPRFKISIKLSLLTRYSYRMQIETGFKLPLITMAQTPRIQFMTSYKLTLMGSTSRMQFKTSFKPTLMGLTSRAHFKTSFKTTLMGLTSRMQFNTPRQHTFYINWKSARCGWNPWGYNEYTFNADCYSTGTGKLKIFRHTLMKI